MRIDAQTYKDLMFELGVAKTLHKERETYYLETHMPRTAVWHSEHIVLIQDCETRLINARTDELFEKLQEEKREKDKDNHGDGGSRL